MRLLAQTACVPFFSSVHATGIDFSDKTNVYRMLPLILAEKASGRGRSMQDGDIAARSSMFLS